MTRLKKGDKIDTTLQLKDAIESALGFLPAAEQKEAVKKACQRTFQALRIDVNREFEVLYEFLEKLPGAGRACGDPYLSLGRGSVGEEVLQGDEESRNLSGDIHGSDPAVGRRVRKKRESAVNEDEVGDPGMIK